MRKHFSEYFRPTEEETKAFWAEAIFIFDTNVLLNLYRLSREQSTKIKEILLKLKSRLFLPHQVGVEFFRHLEGVIAEQVNGFERVRQALKRIPENFSQEFTRHPCIPIAEITAALAECVGQQISRVTKSQEENQLNFLAHEDPVLPELDALFSDCTEEPYLGADDVALEKKVDERVNSNSPPCIVGISGKSAPPTANNPHRGDGRVWFQVVKFAKSHPDKSIIFVTGDQKLNWWRTAKIGTADRIVGPHFELIRDIKAVSERGLLMYTQEEFLANATKYLGVPDQAKAIQEVIQIRERIAIEKDFDSLETAKAGYDSTGEESLKQKNTAIEEDWDYNQSAKHEPDFEKDTDDPRSETKGEVT